MVYSLVDVINNFHMPTEYLVGVPHSAKDCTGALGACARKTYDSSLAWWSGVAESPRVSTETTRPELVKKRHTCIYALSIGPLFLVAFDRGI